MLTPDENGAAPDFGLGRLELEIRDASGRLPQGNLFPILTHPASGRVWRILRYVRHYDGLMFRDLPPGPFRLRIASSHHQTLEIDVALAPGEVRRVRLDLAPKFARPLLVLDTEDLSGAGRKPGSGLAARLLVALLGDENLRRSMQAPLDALPGISQIEHHHAWRLLTLGFPAPIRAVAQRMFWSIIDYRCRLEAVLAATFANEAVARVQDCPRAEVPRAARLAVDGLDRLDIADALMLLAQRAAPWKAVMSEVSRSLAGVHDVLIPAGLAGQLVPDPDPQVPGRPFPRGRWNGKESDRTVLDIGPQAARIAALIAGADPGRTAQAPRFGPLFGIDHEAHA